MKKKLYLQPTTAAYVLNMHNHILAGSNKITEDEVELNPETMEEGDGGDAASRRGTYNIWEEEELEEEEML